MTIATSFRIVICFHDVGSLRTFVCEPFQITKIKSTRNVSLQSSLRYLSTIETVVNVIGPYKM